jgi:predicted PurR-regulated permease PerM
MIKTKKYILGLVGLLLIVSLALFYIYRTVYTATNTTTFDQAEIINTQQKDIEKLKQALNELKLTLDKKVEYEKDKTKQEITDMSLQDIVNELNNELSLYLK